MDTEALKRHYGTVPGESDEDFLARIGYKPKPLKPEEPKTETLADARMRTKYPLLPGEEPEQWAARVQRIEREAAALQQRVGGGIVTIGDRQYAVAESIDNLTSPGDIYRGGGGPSRIT